MLNIHNLESKYHIGHQAVTDMLGIQTSKDGLMLKVYKHSHLVVEKTLNEFLVGISSDNELYVALRLFKENEEKTTFKIEYPKKIKQLTFMLDASRNAVATVDTVKTYLLNLALFGYDALQLYTEDTFEMEDE